MFYAFISKKVSKFISKKEMKSQPSCKKGWSQDLKKGCDEKDVKSKGGGQGLCRNAVDHIKNFDNDDPGVSNVLWPGSLLSKFLM